MLHSPWKHCSKTKFWTSSWLNEKGVWFLPALESRFILPISILWACVEDSQAAACSGQSLGTRAQLCPAASCLLCSTQALSGQKSCTVNPVLMWPGVVTALPVTAGTACLQRPSLLWWVVFLKTVVLHQMGHTVSLCLPLPCRHFVVPSVPLPRVICSFLRGCDGLSASQKMSLRAGLCKHSRLALQMGFGSDVCSASWDEGLQRGYEKRKKNQFERE